MKKLLFLVFVTTSLFVSCEIYPHNTMQDCTAKCPKKKKPSACLEFCLCIHERGEVLDSCLNKYDLSPIETLK